MRPILSVNSVDYLLKPVEPARLDRALDKLQRFTGEARRDMRALAQELAAHLTPGRRVERIASRLADRTIVLDVARISHVHCPGEADMRRARRS